MSDAARIAALEARIARLERHIAGEGDQFFEDARPATILAIMKFVALSTGLTITDLRSDRRCAPIVRARRAAIWVARAATTASYPVIATAFNKDFSTPGDAIGAANRLRDTDSAFRALTDAALTHITEETGQ